MPKCPECGHTFERKKREPKETDPRIKVIIDNYAKQFKDKFGTQPHIAGGACGTLSKRLLNTYGLGETCEFIEQYLNSTDKFFVETGFPFLLLPSFIQKQAVQKNVPKIENKDYKKPPSWRQAPV